MHGMNKKILQCF